MSTSRPPATERPAKAATLCPRPDALAPSIDSRQLLPPGRTTVVIEHGGQRYLLRVTRENKLILTK
ncbi:MAG TPA: hemin uptake protein HemP [Rhodocyclaceae bacterium]|nr:hemin uptake protein HemP [Rhodocyclaceae bacterium]